METKTDCRSPEGITVGLIDGIIATARVIRERENQARHDGEYSEDLRQDDDIHWLMNWGGPEGVTRLKELLKEKDGDVRLLSDTLNALLKNIK